MADADDDLDYEIPLRHKRPFGAGVKRKRIDFVPQSTPSTASSTSKPKQSLQERYLSIVFPKNSSPSQTSSASSIPEQEHSVSNGTKNLNPVLCEICKLPILTTNALISTHEASLAHQVCLSHSHPPSSLDRSRKGLSYLQSYGWDPDSRTGLGATGTGRLYPVRAEDREDNRGVGADKQSEEEKRKEKKLNGKEMKKFTEEQRRKQRRMRDLFYGSDDVNKYLGVEL